MKAATIVGTDNRTNPLFNAKGKPLSFAEVINSPELQRSFYVVMEDDATGQRELVKGFFMATVQGTTQLKPYVVGLFKSVVAHMKTTGSRGINLALDHSQNHVGKVDTVYRSEELGENTYVPTKDGKPTMTLFVVGERVSLLGQFAANNVATTNYDGKTFVLVPSNNMLAWLNAK